VSALTLFSMVKIWSGVFWATAEEKPPISGALEPEPMRLPWLMTASTGILVFASVAFVVAAAPLYELGETAARGLIDPSVYIEAVRFP